MEPNAKNSINPIDTKPFRHLGRKSDGSDIWWKSALLSGDSRWCCSTTEAPPPPFSHLSPPPLSDCQTPAGTSRYFHSTPVVTRTWPGLFPPFVHSSFHFVSASGFSLDPKIHSAQVFNRLCFSHIFAHPNIYLVPFSLMFNWCL